MWFPEDGKSHSCKSMTWSIFIPCKNKKICLEVSLTIASKRKSDVFDRWRLSQPWGSRPTDCYSALKMNKPSAQVEWIVRGRFRVREKKSKFQRPHVWFCLWASHKMTRLREWKRDWQLAGTRNGTGRKINPDGFQQLCIVSVAIARKVNSDGERARTVRTP